MAIYDLGTASLAANGEVTGVGTTWKAPLTLIRVGATIVFKTEPVRIYTISEIISDTQVNVYNPNSETVPAGTGYAILAHDGITVQGLAQDVAETLRYYQSRETEVADAVDAFNNFDSADFESKVAQVNTQHGDVVSIGAQVANDAAQASSDKDSAAASAISASADKDAAAASAHEAADYAASLDTQNLLRKDLAFSDLTDKPLARSNLDVYSKSEVGETFYPNIRGNVIAPATGFVFEPFKRYRGDHEIRYINGGQPKATKSIVKSGHSTVTLVGIRTVGTDPKTLTVDTVGYINPDNADPDGTTFPTGTVFSGLSFQGDDDGLTESGLTILQGHDFKIEDCGFLKSKVGLWMRDVWMTSVENVSSFGQIKHEGGTSAFYKNVFATVKDSTVEQGAFRITNLQYSNMNSCGSDGAVFTAYYFDNNNGLTVNGCGSEMPGSLDPLLGAAAHFNSGNDMVLNGFYTLPAQGTNVIFSIGSNNNIIMNNTIIFGSPSWSLDFWMLGSGNTLTINGGVFGDNGRIPLIGTAAAGNTIIYNAPNGNEYRAKTTGAATPVNLEPKYQTIDLNPISELVFASTGGDINATRDFKLRKNGNIVTIDFTFSLNGLSGQSGAVYINGLPYSSRFFSSGAVGYVTGLNPSTGPVSCFINANGTEIQFCKTSATDGNSTLLEAADMTASARVSGTITYQISSTNFD